VSPKPVFRRRSAIRDAEQATIYYAREAGLDVAKRFVDALEAAYETIGERPGTGSPRHGRELEVSGLRSRLVARFPFLIFYREHEDRVEILRVLQARRNIPAILRGKDS
jgi:toxin ParE1/3/4